MNCLLSATRINCLIFYVGKYSFVSRTIIVDLTNPESEIFGFASDNFFGGDLLSFSQNLIAMIMMIITESIHDYCNNNNIVIMIIILKYY